MNSNGSHGSVHDEKSGGVANPLVSVIIPHFNDEDVIDRALKSVDAQTYEPIEIVLIDSSQSDRLATLGAERTDIIYKYQEPSGIASARNYGISVATGEFIAFLDADDEWLPTKLTQQLTAIQDGADIVYSDVIVVKDGFNHRLNSLSLSDSDDPHIEFFIEGGVPCSTIVARKSCFSQENFDESLRVGEDMHMWVRLFRAFQPAAIHEPLAYYYRRENSLTSDVYRLCEDELEIIEDLCSRFPELNSYRRTVEAKSEYKLGKRLLRTGNYRAARGPLFSSIQKGFVDIRGVSLLAVSLLPIGHQRIMRILERLGS
ncbi:glycosyltransferase family 2 protein [Haladaptatus sp. CMSO5]|uniref:glycosyltransferase family 2 protein n=1 Tax=Haladaptatus sp. CMSO5 TaxID=3120514 RepID=UPI002FCE2442